MHWIWRRDRGRRQQLEPGAAVRVRQQALLMPGDAQWGNWQSWLQESEGTEI